MQYVTGRTQQTTNMHLEATLTGVICETKQTQKSGQRSLHTHVPQVTPLNFITREIDNPTYVSVISLFSSYLTF